MRVYVDTDQVRKKSGEIRLLRDDLQYNMKQIGSLILAVGGAWKGEAGREFASQIFFIKKEFDAVISFFDDYATLMDSFAAQYDEYERNLSARLNLA